MWISRDEFSRLILVLQLMQKEIRKMSAASDALTAAVAASTQETETLLGVVNGLSANVADLTTKLQAAIDAANGADPDLLAAAQAATAGLNDETAKAQAAVSTATPAG